MKDFKVGIFMKIFDISLYHKRDKDYITWYFYGEIQTSKRLCLLEKRHLKTNRNHTPK